MLRQQPPPFGLLARRGGLVAGASAHRQAAAEEQQQRHGDRSEASAPKPHAGAERAPLRCSWRRRGGRHGRVLGRRVAVSVPWRWLLVDRLRRSDRELLAKSALLAPPASRVVLAVLGQNLAGGADQLAQVPRRRRHRIHALTVHAAPTSRIHTRRVRSGARIQPYARAPRLSACACIASAHARARSGDRS